MAVEVGVAVAVAVAVGVDVAVEVAVAVAVEVAVAVAVRSSWTSRRRRCRSSCWQPKGIDPVIRTEVDPTTSDHSGVPLARAGHQFVGAAAGINNGAGIAIIAVQALIAIPWWQRTRQSRYWCHRSL